MKVSKSLFVLGNSSGFSFIFLQEGSKGEGIKLFIWIGLLSLVLVFIISSDVLKGKNLKVVCKSDNGKQKIWKNIKLIQIPLVWRAD